MGLMFLISYIIVGCTSEPYREYNRDDVQDKECYLRMGGRWGYCDKERSSLSQ